MNEMASHTPVSLDPNTARLHLVMSEHLTAVRCGERQQLPRNTERIKDYFCVLCSMGFHSGTQLGLWGWRQHRLGAGCVSRVCQQKGTHTVWITEDLCYFDNCFIWRRPCLCVKNIISVCSSDVCVYMRTEQGCEFHWTACLKAVHLWQVLIPGVNSLKGRFLLNFGWKNRCFELKVMCVHWRSNVLCNSVHLVNLTTCWIKNKMKSQTSYKMTYCQEYFGSSTSQQLLGTFSLSTFLLEVWHHL